MAINKNFVIKNGLEVNSNQIYADSTNANVGIGSTLPTVELDVQGAIAATDVVTSLLRVVGYSTFSNALVNNNFNVTGFSTSSALNVTGLTSVTNFRSLGISTFASDVLLSNNLNVSGFSTFVGLTSIPGNFKVTGISTVSGPLDVGDISVSGVATISTLGSQGTGTYSVDGEGEIITVGAGDSLATLGVATVSPAGLNLTGVLTATSFEGAFSGTGIAIGIQSEGTTVSTATSTINFVPVNASVTVDASDGGSGISTVTIQSSGVSLGLAIALGG